MNRIKASWVGKAAFALIDRFDLSGKEANRLAQGFASELLDYGVAIESIDPKVYALRHFGLAKDQPLHTGPDNQPHSSWTHLQRNIRNCWQPSNWPRLPSHADLNEDYLP